jgi:hypothetical protein
MKKYIILALVLLSTTATAQKKRLAVLDFTPHNLPEAAAKSLRSRFELALFRYGTFDLLERDKIDLIAREHRVSVKCATADCAVRIGKLVSADYIATGTVDKEREYTIVLRVVDVSRGIIAYADSENYPAENSSVRSLETLASRVSARFSPEEQNQYSVKSYAAIGGGLINPQGDLETIAGKSGGPFLSLGFENYLYRGSLFEVTLLYGELPGVGHLTGSTVIPLLLSYGHSFYLLWGFSVSPHASLGMSWNRVYTDEGKSSGLEPAASLGLSLRYKGRGPWFMAARSSRIWIMEGDGALYLDAHQLYVGLYL